MVCAYEGLKGLGWRRHGVQADKQKPPGIATEGFC